MSVPAAQVSAAQNQQIPVAQVSAAPNKPILLTFDKNYWNERFPKIDFINMDAKEFHLFENQHGLTPEQRKDLRRVRRRDQCKRAAKTLRARKRATATEPVESLADEHAESLADEPDDVNTDVIGDVIKRARTAASNDPADDDIEHLWEIIARMQEETERMQTARDAANAMMQLSGTASYPNDTSGKMYEDFL